jgi:hypothetical protein
MRQAGFAAGVQLSRPAADDTEVEHIRPDQPSSMRAPKLVLLPAEPLGLFLNQNPFSTPRFTRRRVPGVQRRASPVWVFPAVWGLGPDIRPRDAG